MEVNNNVTKKTILGIGASGLIGSRLGELLFEKYRFINLSLETGVDIARKETLQAIGKYDADSIVLHLAAKADVDGCENDMPLGNEGDAWKINVTGTQNVIDICTEKNMKIIYISTDFVFDGENPPVGGYTEESIPAPINWYGQTKLQAEEIVHASGSPYLILRLAYPYRKPFALKKDFVQVFLSRLRERKVVTAITDHIITPTFVDDIAHAMDILIQKKATGIYHVVGSQCISPYEAAMLVAQTFGFDTGLVQKSTREVYFADRAQRPFNLSLSNATIQKLGIKMKTFEEGLQEVKFQMTNFK